MSCVLLEATDKLGGLWTYRKDMNYGAMSFTHINVSKVSGRVVDSVPLTDKYGCKESFTSKLTSHPGSRNFVIRKLRKKSV